MELENQLKSHKERLDRLEKDIDYIMEIIRSHKLEEGGG
jgi:hypothetical protein